MIAIDKACRDNPWRMVVIRCQHLVLATGGPGELYRDSVYPVNCFSALGMALEAGITLVNLTESQFGIGTPRSQFPWNLSGTYMQAMPRIYSQDHSGRQYNFLAAYYPTTRMLASAIFRKGYQWPFHAERMLEYGSSLLDVAVYEETQKGRDVFLDFLREPEPAADGTSFNLQELDDDVIDYLQQNHALLAQPLARLTQMNPLAIRLYQMHGHDLTASPLKFTLNNQHLNGGIEVDIWGRTSLTGCYAAGENAGTHGVTRPGGAALNAGQVFARRCALHIAHQKSQDRPLERQQILSTINEAQQYLNQGLLRDDVRETIQNTMSHHAAILCHTRGSTLPRKPRQHFVKIFAGKVFNAMKTAWHNLSSGGKVRNWRWLYCVLYNVMSKTVVGVVVPGLSMMAKPVLHRKHQGHSWPGVFGQKIRMPGNI